MMPRICAVLPCSAALARQIHHPDTRRVISSGLGNTVATRGISMKGRRHAEPSSPPHSVCTHTYTDIHMATTHLQILRTVHTLVF